MSSSAFKEKTSYEKWLALPENVVGEIIMGELHVSPRPAQRHGNASSSLLEELMGPFQKGRRGGPGGWIITMEPEIHNQSHILVPDLAGWKRERVPDFPNQTFFIAEPDWVCEVLSPGTAAYDRTKKMPVYANLGVKFFWLIDPVEKTLDVYENAHCKWVLQKTYANDDKVRAVPFDAIEFELAALWG